MLGQEPSLHPPGSCQSVRAHKWLREFVYKLKAHLEKVGDVAPTPEETIPAPNNAENPVGGWEPGSPLEDLNF